MDPICDYWFVYDAGFGTAKIGCIMEGKKMTMRKAKYMMYVPLVVIGLISLVPFLWLVRNSFMDSYEIFEFP